MDYRAVLRVLGFISLGVGAAMLPPMLLSLFDRGEDFIPFVISMAIPLAAGTVLVLSTRGEKIDLRHKEGFAIVTFSWLVSAAIGMLPYYLSGACDSMAAAFFEAMSGFTTTGSTIFTNVEGLPRGILLWRSVTQWVGGMGIVLLGVAVLPLLGVGGMALFRAEVPGPVADRLSPRIQSTAKALWVVYLAITVAETALLMVGGMSFFEAVCHSFCTVSTGGFSTRNGSVGAYDSVFIETVVIVFMFVAGVNFSLHLNFAKLQWKRYISNEEMRLYTVLTVLAIGIAALSLHFSGRELPGDAIRHAAFQVVSIFTTTGFGTQDYLLWGFGLQILLVLLMFMGACAGSTSGGLKMMRVVILAKHGVAVVKKEIHPRAILKIRYSGKVVPDDVMMKVLGFFLVYIFVFFAVAFLVALLGVDVETSLGASVATLSNIGPGLGTVGPASTYADLPGAAQFILAMAMMMGRLELFTVLVVLSPMFWRRT